jgi:glycosyltransferase involved in cell wall biosynthesis
MTKRLIISAVNLVEGGTLTVLRDCLSATSTLGSKWEIIALVHDRRLFNHPWVTFLEYPKAKNSWLKRLYHEFVLFKRLADEYHPDAWLSMHDISPRVSAKRRVVYCHNPAPFYVAGWKDLRWDPRFFLFTLFYRYLYQINIHSNDLVVVQQEWIRQAFQRMFHVENVAVARPVGTLEQDSGHARPTILPPGVFLYPALPRTFKNFEVLCEAAELLYHQRGSGFEVRLTLSENESAYANHLFQRYGHCPAIQFIGRQTPDQMRQQYEAASAVVFPSKLETWGLPISESKQQGKPLLVSDLPYAHESVGDYGLAAFFPPDDAKALANLMASILDGCFSPIQHAAKPVLEPFATDWQSLLQLVVGK